MAVPTPEIDLVYCWVDGNCPRYQASRNKYITGPVVEGSSGAQRYRSLGEIYASIRSAWVFAPWLRKIWVIIDDVQLHRFDRSQVTNSAHIHVVPHSVIFRKVPSHLPTFNSQALETHLAEIPGLSELFLYSNDDTFFGAPCTWTQFFAGDKPKVLQQGILQDTLVPNMEPYARARVNSSALLNRLKGRKIQRSSVGHHIKPLTRSLFRQAYKHPVIRQALLSTSASRFRSSTDIEPVGFLLSLALQQRRAHVANGLKCYYTGIWNTNNLVGLAARLSRYKYHLYCLNDTLNEPSEERLREVTDFIATKLPSSQRDPVVKAPPRTVRPAPRVVRPAPRAARPTPRAARPSRVPPRTGPSIKKRLRVNRPLKAARRPRKPVIQPTYRNANHSTRMAVTSQTV